MFQKLFVKTAIVSVFACLWLVLQPASLEAAMKLRLTSGATVVEIEDNSAADTNPLAGLISFSGAIGPDWLSNIAIGYSKPLLGSPQAPEIDLFSAEVSSSAATASITIELTDTDFVSPGPPAFVFGIGGTTQGTVSASAYLDAANAEYGTGTSLASVGPLTGNPSFAGAFAAGGNSSVVPAAGPYSLSVSVTIDHVGDGRRPTMTSFDASLSAVPEPASLAVWGFMLSSVGGMGLVRWSRSRG